jgi:hypothetical protein
MAYSMASSTIVVVMVVAARQPRIRRAEASMTKATAQQCLHG